jgi:hypothetical protein
MNDHIDRVTRAWRDQYNNEGVFTWPVDVFEDYVVVSWYLRMSKSERKFYQVNYTMADDGTVTFAPRDEWVEVELTYAPAGMGGDETPAEESVDGTVRESFQATVEAVGDEGERYNEAVILTEGLSSNGRMYTKKALKSGVKVFTGALVFADHPAMSEEADRPERSVRDVVGRLGKAYVGTNKEGKSALRAPLKLSETADWLRTLISEGIVDGLSIRAMGKGKDSDEGVFTVESFIEHPYTSVDFVTVPAAGGYAEFRESRHEDNPLALLDAEALRRHRPDLVDELTQESEFESVRVVRLREGESEGDLASLQETHRKLEEAHQKLEQEFEALQEAHGKLFKRVREQEGREFLEAQLRETRLPKATLAKLRAEGQRLIKAYATHGSDETPEQLKATLSATVEAEKKYLAQILPHGIVSGGSAETGPTQAEVGQELTEAFEGLVPPGTEKIAVRGRS